MTCDPRVSRLLDSWLESGLVKCTSLRVFHRGQETMRYGKGLCRFSGEDVELRDDTLFTIASPTKTLTASCFMQYVEEGTLSLHEPVVRFLPAFGQNGKAAVTFFHLLTHTSGLAEQVEGKDELRRRAGSLGEFNERICASKLLFGPGTDYQYSNCGFSILGRVIEEIEGSPFGQVLAKRIFDPLGMRDSVLGADASWDPRIAEIELPPGKEETRAFLNTRYWRGLGAPWGGMISNTRDLAVFAEAVRSGGAFKGNRILSSATVAVMTADQLATQRAFAAKPNRRKQGLAWILKGPGDAQYGDLTSEATYGHGGATCSLLWIDPVNAITFVFLGNREGSIPPHYFARLSNAVVGAVLG